MFLLLYDKDNIKARFKFFKCQFGAGFPAFLNVAVKQALEWPRNVAVNETSSDNNGQWYTNSVYWY
jgi:hypothetical protein